MLTSILALSAALQTSPEPPANLQEGAVGSQTASASSTIAPDVPHLIDNPVWESEPDETDIATAYPEKARQIGLKGQAVLSCSASSKGIILNCKVLSELPLGYSFGEAALQVSHYWRLKSQDANGLPQGGGIVTLPVTFSLPTPAPRR